MPMKSKLIAIILASAFTGLPASGQNLDAGRDLFLSACLRCHAFACNRDGPRLGGLLGRKVGTLADYAYYSQEMKDAGFIWSEEKLDRLFTDPTKMFPDSIKGTSTTNDRLNDAEQRKNLIAFLKSEDPSVDIFCSQ